MRRTIAATVTVTALALGPAAATAAAPQKITFSGVGQVKLGMTFQQLRAKHLVGKLRKGCELAGPNARSARLRSPLRGTVNFTQTSPRKAENITITGGAEARGVGIGDKLADIKAKFPKRKVDHSQEGVFGLTFVFVRKKSNPKLMFAIDVSTKKITAIGVPIIAVCE
jgi:hypothetical protein